MAHREDGGAAGMLGRRGQREMSRPRWRRVVRRRVVRRRVVRRRVVRRRGVERGWGRSKVMGLFECRWKHQAPEKDFQDAFISF